MTEAELTRLTAENAERRRIKDAATPVGMPGDWVPGMEDDGPNWLIGSVVGRTLFIRVMAAPGKTAESDANFIARARNDNSEDTIDALLTEVRRLHTLVGKPGESVPLTHPIDETKVF